MKKTMLAVAAVAAFVAAGPASAQYSSSSTYANPDQTTTAVYQGAKKVCNDPWVTIALIRVFGSADPAYCATGLYNGGQWNDFNQLVHAVAATRQSFNSQGVVLKAATLNGAPAVAILMGGQMVAAGGGNMVAAGGGNMVAAGGGNLIVPTTLPPANLTSSGSYALQGGKSVRLPVGGLRW